ncbi:hypothetical protein DL770_009699 [Monosporascus sp. CRB-9-2]|nr:hypothetical protein DL770_009699 [Monosporascus sp. CRB-9-2]
MRFDVIFAADHPAHARNSEGSPPGSLASAEPEGRNSESCISTAMTRAVQARTVLKVVELPGRQQDTSSASQVKVGDSWDDTAKAGGQDHPQLNYAVRVEDLVNMNLVSDDHDAVAWVSVNRVDGLAMTHQMRMLVKDVLGRS